MEPSEFRLDSAYRSDIQTTITVWANNAGLRRNQRSKHLTKDLMAAIITQLGKEKEFFQLEGIHRPDDPQGPSQFKKVDRRSKRIPRIPSVSVTDFFYAKDRVQGLSVSRYKKVYTNPNHLKEDD